MLSNYHFLMSHTFCLRPSPNLTFLPYPSPPYVKVNFCGSLRTRYVLASFHYVAPVVFLHFLVCKYFCLETFSRPSIGTF